MGCDANRTPATSVPHADCNKCRAVFTTSAVAEQCNNTLIKWYPIGLKPAYKWFSLKLSTHSGRYDPWEPESLNGVPQKSFDMIRSHRVVYSTSGFPRMARLRWFKRKRKCATKKRSTKTRKKRKNVGKKMTEENLLVTDKIYGFHINQQIKREKHWRWWIYMLRILQNVYKEDNKIYFISYREYHDIFGCLLSPFIECRRLDVTGFAHFSRMLGIRSTIKLR